VKEPIMTPHLSSADEAVDYEKLLVHNCPPRLTLRIAR
jgi:hypothetical protein